MNTHRSAPDRGIRSRATRRWAYGIAAAAVPVLVVYGIVTTEEGTAWLALAGAILAPAGLGLAAANVPGEDD